MKVILRVEIKFTADENNNNNNNNYVNTTERRLPHFYTKMLYYCLQNYIMNSKRPFFPAKYFFETNNIFLIRGKNPFLFHYEREDKKLNRVKLHSVSKMQLNKFPTSVQHQTLY